MIKQTMYEINNLAIKALMKELGSVNTLRFLRQYTGGQGDYTKEKEALFEGETVDSLLDQIKAMRQQTSTQDPEKS